MNKLKIGEIPVWCRKCEKYFKFVSPYEVMCKCGKSILLKEIREYGWSKVAKKANYWL